MRFPVWVVVVLAAVSCAKKSYEAYAAIEQQERQLVADLGDDAWDSPQMRVIVQALDAVPNDAKEKERAVALVQTIALERLRVQKLALTRRTAEPKYVDTPLPPPLPREEVIIDVDAGAATPAPAPSAGMTLEAFEQAYGTCFVRGEPVQLSAMTAATLIARNDGACEGRFGRPGVRTVWLFVDGKLWGTRVQLEPPQMPAFDGGVADAPPRDVTPRAPGDDGGNVLLMIPGAPLPAALQPVGMQRVDAGAM